MTSNLIEVRPMIMITWLLAQQSIAYVTMEQ